MTEEPEQKQTIITKEQALEAYNYGREHSLAKVLPFSGTRWLKQAGPLEEKVDKVHDVYRSIDGWVNDERITPKEGVEQHRLVDHYMEKLLELVPALIPVWAGERQPVITKEQAMEAWEYGLRHSLESTLPFPGTTLLKQGGTLDDKAQKIVRVYGRIDYRAGNDSVVKERLLLVISFAPSRLLEVGDEGAQHDFPADLG